MGAMNFLFYLLPAILAFVVVYLVICIIRKKKKQILVSIIAIAVMSGALAVYYYPCDNILNKYDFDSIDIHSSIMPDVKVTDKESMDRILKVINKHTF